MRFGIERATHELQVASTDDHIGPERRTKIASKIYFLATVRHARV
jgi:hypothetical protein